MAPCHSREAVVTVQTYDKGIMTGCLRHPRLEEKEEFQSLSQMMLLLNGLMDLENSPDHPLPLIHSESGNQEIMAVFHIQILFREHHTWQGRLVWQEENLEMVFHSAIELMELLDEILAE